MTALLDISLLKAWFLAERRPLPWRQHRDPYAIWISEVMLQQTQVAVVIPYFLRWMERFPSIASLAAASLDEVIKMWEGLGYYSRARYLHQGAQYVLAHFNGKLPKQEEELKEIKGLGPYTIGAILSFAFHQKKAAVDGNVIRVLTRYFEIQEDVAKPATVQRLRKLVEKLLPDEEPWIINKALIELGATICQRKAHCSKCPLKNSCLSYRNGTVGQFPVKTKRTKTEYLYRAVAVITNGSDYLIKRGQKGEIMQDLHEFPFFETAAKGWSDRKLQQTIEQNFRLKVEKMKKLASIEQSFTRYQVRLDAVLFQCSHAIAVTGFTWLNHRSLEQLAFSSGHRRIFQQVQADDWLLPA